MGETNVRLMVRLSEWKKERTSDVAAQMERSQRESGEVSRLSPQSASNLCHRSLHRTSKLHIHITNLA